MIQFQFIWSYINGNDESDELNIISDNISFNYFDNTVNQSTAKSSWGEFNFLQEFSKENIGNNDLIALYNKLENNLNYDQLTINILNQIAEGPETQIVTPNTKNILMPFVEQIYYEERMDVASLQYIIRLKIKVNKEISNDNSN